MRNALLFALLAAIVTPLGAATVRLRQPVPAVADDCDGAWPDEVDVVCRAVVAGTASAEAVEAAGREASDALLQAALGPLRFTARGATLAASANAAQREADVDRQLAALAELGVADTVLTAYDALPPALQRHVASGPGKVDLAMAAVLARRPCWPCGSPEARRARYDVDRRRRISASSRCRPSGQARRNARHIFGALCATATSKSSASCRQSRAMVRRGDVAACRSR